MNSFNDGKVLYNKIELGFLEVSFNVRKWKADDEFAK